MNTSIPNLSSKTSVSSSSFFHVILRRSDFANLPSIITSNERSAQGQTEHQDSSGNSPKKSTMNDLLESINFKSSIEVIRFTSWIIAESIYSFIVKCITTEDQGESRSQSITIGGFIASTTFCKADQSNSLCLQ